jgi:hypothetical protein
LDLPIECHLGKRRRILTDSLVKTMVSAISKHNTAQTNLSTSSLLL